MVDSEIEHDFQDYLGAKAAGLQAIMVDRYS